MRNGKMRVEYDNGRESQEKSKGNYISVTSCQTTTNFLMVSKTFIFVKRVADG
jgi:hypothetical protein